MLVVIQRVKNAEVFIHDKVHSFIGKGLLVLVGIEDADGKEDATWLSNKIVNLRIFDDENGIANLSCKDVNADIMVVSQFTLHAQTKKGNRPSYIKASKPDFAIPLYEYFLDILRQDLGKQIPAGVFGSEMQINLINDGPLTIIIDSQNKN
ncbi:MAG: D-aminoacyl-tRNA deacylase [Ferruginibacter sp.]